VTFDSPKHPLRWLRQKKMKGEMAGGKNVTNGTLSQAVLAKVEIDGKS